MYKDELAADWQLALNGEKIFKIKPLEKIMVKINDVQWISGYQLKVVFEDHCEKLCDLTKFLEKGDFVELKDLLLFKQFKNTGISIEWPNELDLSSDTLYMIGE